MIDGNHIHQIPRRKKETIYRLLYVRVVMRQSEILINFIQ
jgi:hypothetical protein